MPANFGNHDISTSGSITADGSVGIGTASPSHKLDVSGVGRFVHADGDCGLIVEDTGGSGVHIGDCAFDGDTYAGIKHSSHTGLEYMLISNGDNTVMSAAQGFASIIRGGLNSTSSEIRVNDTVDGGAGVVINNQYADRDVRIHGTGDPYVFYVDASADSVGIGTASPSEKLDVNGGIGHVGWKTFRYIDTAGPNGSDNGFAIKLNDAHGTTLNTQYHYRIRLTTDATATTTGATYLVWYKQATSSWEYRVVSWAGSISNHCLLAISGSNAIAYTNYPSASYDINCVIESYHTSNQYSLLHSMGSDYQWQRYVDTLYYNDGNVGVGTSASVTSRFQVEGGDVAFNQNNGSNIFKVGSTASDNLLYVDGTSNDKVGIGTASPSYKLDVNGSGNFSGSVTATSLIKSGGTSSQFLKADGSVDGSTYAKSVGIGGYSAWFQSTGGGNDITYYGSDTKDNIYVSTDMYFQSKYGMRFLTDSPAGFLGFGTERLHLDTSEAVFNDGGNNYDFRVEGDADANLLFTDASSDRVGIGTDSPSQKLDVDGSIRTISGGIGHHENGCYIAYPGGGSLRNASSTQTGYLKITLPVSWTNTMISFDIDVYEYATQKIKKFRVGGYTYSVSTQWINESAMMDSDNDFAKYKVHFGHDGTNCAIYISEIDSSNTDLGSSTTWSYAQVSISNIYAGYAATTMNSWASGWNIDFTTTLGTTTGSIEVSRPYRQHDTSYVFNGTVEFDDLVRWKYPDKLLDSNISDFGYLRFYDETNGIAGVGISASSFNIGTSGAVNFRVITDNTERIIVGSNGNTVVNEEGHAVNFRVEGDADENLLIARGAGGTDKVGIGCSPSLGKLHIQALYTNNNGHDAIYIDQRNTSSSNGTYNNTGIDLLSRKLVNSGVSDTGQILGADIVATLDGDGSLNNSYGVRTWGGIYINNSGSLTNAWGIQPRVINGGYNGASITNAYGVDILIDGDLYDRIDGNSITTAMGLRIRGIEHAANKWAIYQEGVSDNNYFAGNVGVGAPSPSYKLEINGNIGLTNDGFYASPTGVMVGTNGWLYNDGQIAVSHGSFSSDGDAQNSTYILRGSTTNATFTTIQNNGSNVVLASNRTMMFTANIVGRRTNGSDNGAYKLEGMLYNDGYGASIIGTPVKTTIGETDSSWDVQATITGAGAGGSDYLNIQVKGATSKDVNWVAKLELLEVGGDITSYTEANILDIDANIIP